MYPYLLHLGHLYLPTFGVLAAAGLMLALLVSQRTAAWTQLDPEALWDAGLFAVIAAFILSRMLLIAENFRSFLSSPLLVLTLPSVTAAGLFGTLVVTLIWLRRHRLPLLAVMDAWAPCATLAWAFIALGHFAEADDLGLPARFGVRLPGQSTPLHPVALYVAAYALLLTIGLLSRLRRGRRAAAAGLIGAGIGQFFLGFIRQPDLSGITSLLDPLQWVAVGMVVSGVVMYVFAELSTELILDRKLSASSS